MALLGGRQNRLHLAEVNEHRARAPLAALHHAGHHVPVAALELAVDDVPLGLTDALGHHLFRGLRGDAAELGRRDLDVEVIALAHRRIEAARRGERHFQVRVLDVLHHLLPGEHRRHPVFPVNLDVDFAGRPMVLLVGGDERGFDDLAQCLERDIFLPANIA